MLSEESIDKLETLINTHAGDDREELLGALEDIARVIGTQTLLVRNMGIRLQTALVNQMAIEQIVESDSLGELLSNLTPPKRNAFTMAEAKTASEALVAKVNSATNFAEILKGVVQVAKVFI